MNKERVKKYLNKNCVIILNTKYKYEGIIKNVYEDTLILNDIKLGDIELDISSIILITKLNKDDDGRQY